MRRETVTIHGRKIPGYPSLKKEMEFDEVLSLVQKIDEFIDETGWGKADVTVSNDGQLTEDEVEFLEDEYIHVE